MKRKTFNNWLKSAKFPQGNYETWKVLEIDQYARRAWKAGQAAVMERIKVVK